MSRSILAPVLVSRIGFGGALIVFHPSHDMGSLFCRACFVWGWGDRAARRLCPKARHIEGIGL